MAAKLGQKITPHLWYSKDAEEAAKFYYEALLRGGSAEPCGWLQDRFGVSWQIVPRVFGDMITDPDRTKAKRATEAMLKMTKLDIAALQKAYEGR